MSEERRLAVLRAIVSEYVQTREPVGSKVIASSHDLGVSSATIRNDMAVLEEAGLIYQPHTSAGRVPTDRGYRLFVDRLTTLKPMSSPERRAVEAFLSQSADLDDVVNRAVRLLAQVTRQVAVVEYPTTSAETLLRVELVDLAPHRLLVVIITASGRVEQRLVEAGDTIDAADLAAVRLAVNEHGEGLSNDGLAAARSAIEEATPVAARPLLDLVLDTTIALLHGEPASRLVMAGMSNLARSGVDFRDIAPVLDALEEQVVLLRLFSDLTREAGDLRVTIGAENDHDALTEASVITGTYGVADGSGAHLGVVGPTRMDYPRTMATVRAVAAYLSRYLTN